MPEAPYAVVKKSYRRKQALRRSKAEKSFGHPVRIHEGEFPRQEASRREGCFCPRDPRADARVRELRKIAAEERFFFLSFLFFYLPAVRRGDDAFFRFFRWVFNVARDTCDQRDCLLTTLYH